MTEMRTDPLSIAQMLIRHNSVTPNVETCLDEMEELLSAKGFTCHRLKFSEQGTYDVDNLYARIGNKAPHICFGGHVDVVPTGPLENWSCDPFKAEIKDGKLYGRGAADMKGGVAAFMAAAIRYVEEKGDDLPGSISLLITGDEENMAINGTIKMLTWAEENGEVFDHAIVGEPTNPTELGEVVKIGRRGSYSARVIVKGTQGHVAYPHLADNPMPSLAKLATALTSDPVDQGNANFQPSNLEIVNIHVGNTASNIIPASGTIEFNVRFNDQWDVATLEEWVRQRLQSAGVPHDWELEALPSPSDAFITQPGLLVDIMSKSIEQKTGNKPALKTDGGTSDARFIKNYCPVIEFGLVTTTMHKADEHLVVDDLLGLTDIYHQFLNDYFEALS